MMKSKVNLRLVFARSIKIKFIKILLKVSIAFLRSETSGGNVQCLPSGTKEVDLNEAVRYHSEKPKN